MVVKLIPNDITVSEQFRIRKSIIDGIYKWSGKKNFKDIDLKQLETETGIRCQLIVHDYMPNGMLINFECVDPKLYIWFTLRWK